MRPSCICFQMYVCAGLDASQPSLLLATMPGGHLLQATSSGVRTLPSTSLSASSSPAPGLEWRPPAGAAAPSLSLAAAKGSWVAVVAGSFLHLLHMDPAAGQLQACHVQSLGSSSHVSALALLCLQASPGRVAVQQGMQHVQGSIREENLYVALGDWSQGSLTLFSLTQLCGAGHGASGSGEAALKLQLPGGETPRSVACLASSCPAAGVGAVDAKTSLLLVGTNGGTVLAYELTQAAAAAGASGVWQVAAARQVRISNVAVELQEVDAGAKQTSTLSTGGASAGEAAGQVEARAKGQGGTERTTGVVFSDKGDSLRGKRQGESEGSGPGSRPLAGRSRG